ncbi:MAG: hypothetical protein QXE52_08410, partial [Candidatus Caldarchaeum sp.]
GALYIANIVPLKRVPDLPPYILGGELPDETGGFTPVFLTARAKQDVIVSLRAQGADPEQYILPASVHKHKAILWQGIVFATTPPIGITEHANPDKPMPSSKEVQRLWNKLVNDTEDGEMT